MRFALITPVFDGCIESLELLYSNIAVQTHNDWLWVLVGNQFSDKMLRFVRSKQMLDQKGRIIYTVVNLKDEKNRFSLIANIGKRRDLCINYIDADYFLMLNADSKIMESMLSAINQELEKTRVDLCIYKIVSTNGVTFPIYPFVYKGIDSLNFCVSSRVARQVGYPKNANFRQLNDWRFFLWVFNECKGHYRFIDQVLGEYNANNRYKTVCSIYWGNTLHNQFLKEYIAYCFKENNLLGFGDLIKELMIAWLGVPSRLFAENRTYS